MLELLVVLTIVEVVLALGVLAVYLVLVLQRLRGAALYFGKISFGVRAIHTQTGQIGPAVRQINETLEEITGALPGIAEKAERLAARR